MYYVDLAPPPSQRCILWRKSRGPLSIITVYYDVSIYIYIYIYCAYISIQIPHIISRTVSESYYTYLIYPGLSGCN